MILVNRTTVNALLSGAACGLLSLIVSSRQIGFRGQNQLPQSTILDVSFCNSEGFPISIFTCRFIDMVKHLGWQQVGLTRRRYSWSSPLGGGYCQ